MADADSKVQYTTVAFTPDQSNKPFVKTRKGTLYANVIPHAINESLEGEPQPFPRGRTQSLDRRQVPASKPPQPLEATYDVPPVELPPPVPTRFQSTEEPRPPNNDPFQPLERASPSPMSPVDPFFVDPFGSEQDEWSDPASFYERPPPPRPVLQSHMPLGRLENGSGDFNDDEEEVDGEGEGEKEEEGEELPRDVGESDGFDLASTPQEDDTTGGSAYEDASQFILEAQRRGPSKEKSLETDWGKERDLFSAAGEVFQGEPEGEGAEEEVESQYDVPSGERCLPDREEHGGYEFPTELAKHPYKKGNADNAVPQVSRGGGASPSPVKHTTNSDYARVPSRHEMPLPPLPTGQAQSYGHALPRGGTNKTSSPPPLPARPLLVKQEREEPPPLPPMNFPRRNASQDDPTHPPLPPRGSTKKAGANGHQAPPPEAAPPTSRAGGTSVREDGIMELVALGYSRSDVVRALAVSKNDAQLARMILKEFGGR